MEVAESEAARGQCRLYTAGDRYMWLLPGAECVTRFASGVAGRGPSHACMSRSRLTQPSSSHHAWPDKPADYHRTTSTRFGVFTTRALFKSCDFFFCFCFLFLLNDEVFITTHPSCVHILHRHANNAKIKALVPNVIMAIWLDPSKQIELDLVRAIFVLLESASD
jgi:hypothetical protein